MKPGTLIAIVGPTASGKSALGIRLAQEFGGEVLACDSTQIYRHFDIGTGKVAPEERQGIAHHLMNLAEPHEVFTAGDYRQRALAVLGDLRARGKLPVFTIGTGLYLRALLEGLADAPTRSEELRTRLRGRAVKRGPAYLHRILARLDTAAAARIAAQDEPKLIRAIEVCVLAGKPISEVHRGGRAPLEGWTPVKIGLNPPREELYERVNSRVQGMLDAGWLEEVRRLIAIGLPADAKPFQFIGYSDLRSHLEPRGDFTSPQPAADGEGDFISPPPVLDREGLEQTIAAIQQATRRYAKRQLTWFRKEPGVHWIPAFGDETAALEEARRYLREQG
ncbi:MAG: tRNA (adenosine(37)-N6)-dimethylallyltransferase MiaA [Candidatus Acidiferrales bacterium]